MRTCSVLLVAAAATAGAIGAGAGCHPAKRAAPDAGPPPAAVTLTGVGPRSTSNETDEPLLLYGRGLRAGLKLHLGAPFERDLPLVVEDATHAHALLPAGLKLPDAAAEATAELSLVDDKGAAAGDAVELTVVNDTGFVDVTGLVVVDGFAFTASPTTDELFALDLQSGAVARVRVGDGPWALAPAGDDVAVVHRYAASLELVAARPGTDGRRAVRTLPGPAYAHAVVVDNGVAYIGEHARDTLWAVDLKTGAVKWRVPVGPNPQGIAVAGDRIAIGSVLDGEVQLVSEKDGAVSRGVAPRPGVELLGGHTEPWAKDVMGGKGVRALVYDTKAKRLFVASAGPNVGPNPDHMGVSPTGGVGVIDPATLRYTRHLARNFGVDEALALDQKRGRLYAADIAEGLIHVVDARALVDKDAKKAREAWLGAVALPPPEGFPTFRPAADFAKDGLDFTAEAAPPKVGDDVERRAGIEVHAGPAALALSADAKTLYVLERFTGRVTALDVSGDKPTVTRSWPLFDPLVQKDRRLGEVIFYADLGRTGMSCDVCHHDGSSEGVFFTKTGMERIWRSPTVRGTRDTPPYFNPPAHPTLEDTVSYVGSNNRFQNPKMSPDEVKRLALYARSLTTWRNPFRARDGGFVDALALDGGATGHPDKGRSIFEGRCAGCHPAPLYATDQDEKTRRRFMRLDTPQALPLRVEQQNTSFDRRTPPSLVGAWDVWPMLLSASAGFSVKDGDHLEATDHDPVRAVLERYSGRSHGDAMSLSPEARADLEAFVLSL